MKNTVIPNSQHGHWAPKPDLLMMVKGYDLPLLVIEIESQSDQGDRFRLLTECLAYTRLWGTLEIENIQLLGIYVTKNGVWEEYMFTVLKADKVCCRYFKILRPHLIWVTPEYFNHGS